MNNIVKRSILTVMSYMILAMMVSISIKMNLGIGSPDAFNLTLSNLSTIEVGTISIVTSSLFTLGQIIVLRKDFPIIQYAQFIASLLMGVIINFMVYELFKDFSPEQYSVRLILNVLATVVAAVCVGFVLAMNVVNFPLEGFCLALSKRFPKLSFKWIRQGYDIFCTVFALTISLIFGFQLPIREGTIISIMLFSHIVQMSYSYFSKKTWTQS